MSMHRNYFAYRKDKINESIFVVEQYLQERGIEIVKREADGSDLDYLTALWIKSPKGKIYRIVNFHGEDLHQTLYLVYWDWAIKSGGINPIKEDVSFVAVPHIIDKDSRNIPFKRCVDIILKNDNFDGIIAAYDSTGDSPFNPFDAKLNNRKTAYIEEKYIENVDKFMTKMFETVGDFYRTWFFKSGEIFVISVHKNRKYTVQKINPILI